MCLGADVTRGKHQLPFDGQIDYDYILWIDSDVIFTPQQFTRLLSYQLDIVSGVYLMSNGSQFAVVESWDEQFFNKNGYFKFLTPQDLNGKEGLIDVAYAGMGFMLVKKGVFESMEYPWFKPVEKKIGDMNDFTSEDVAFCLTAREKGFRIWVDPGVRVGHEKRVVL